MIAVVYHKSLFLMKMPLNNAYFVILQANSEVCALLGRIPFVVVYHPTLAMVVFIYAMF